MLSGLDLNERIVIGSLDDEEPLRDMFQVPEKPATYRPIFALPALEIAIPVTGGLDSSALYYMAEKEQRPVRAFYIDVDPPYRAKEIIALEKMGIKFGYINSGLKLDSRKFWKHIIPARNFYFLSLIAEKLERGGEIWFGATAGEMPLKGGDKSLAFLDYCNRMFAKLPYPVVVKTPLSEMTKTDIVAWWIKNAPVEKLGLTISCFEAERGHCGHCQSCLRKALAYAANGLILQTNVDVRTGCTQYIEKYLTAFTKALRERDFSHYSERRMRQDLRAIKLLMGRS
jgi:7-cyano-7-deazaguanine synthase in queuosine biosynthesis